ncbi:MAG: hypothetical protein Q9192_005088 [Flavoplaca navasiana]
MVTNLEGYTLASGDSRYALLGEEAHYNTFFGNNSIIGVLPTVKEGFTFVFSSIHVAFGDISTVDSPGKDHYNPTLGTRAFDPANIRCLLDYGPETLFVEQDSLIGISTYRPLMQIPNDLQNLDPNWKSCFVGPNEGIDPPHALVPASEFEDDPVAMTSVAQVQQPTPGAVIPPLPEVIDNGGRGNLEKPPGSPQTNLHVPIPQNTPSEGSSGPSKR